MTKRLFMFFKFLPVALLFPLFSCAQTFEWWRDNVKWNGTDHWGTFIQIRPKYLGPNALSVPLINTGSVDTASSIGITANVHTSKGDKTQNLMIYGNYTTPKNTISVDLQYVPYEHYKMSHATKTERKVYYKNYYDSHTVGDFVVNTTIQLFPAWRDKAQLALRLGFRMPAGRHLGAARYGDVPSYWIDIGSGFPLGTSGLKWISMAGFFVWQTNIDKYRQDDAILFGSGFEWNRKNFKLQAYCAGYSGYQNNGDRPTLLRLSLEKRKKQTVYLVRLQEGLHDFSYFSVEAGARFVVRHGCEPTSCTTDLCSSYTYTASTGCNDY
jgi:hypothetical protein